jgi:c-di-GMP-binding flagellar brake protein YcgR
MDERRIKPRWLINQRAELTVENGVRAIPCFVEDISQAGIRISLKRDLFDDAFLNFKLALVDDFELNVGAQVVRHEQQYEKNIYALSFNRIDNSTKEEIDQYVKKNFREQIVKHWWEEEARDVGTQDFDPLADK